jgi:hypothetical protein
VLSRGQILAVCIERISRLFQRNHGAFFLKGGVGSRELSERHIDGSFAETFSSRVIKLGTSVRQN